MVKKNMIVAGVMFTLAGCYNSKYNELYPPATAATCDTASISYARDIAPIIAANCLSPGNGCHDVAGSATSGYDYASGIAALQGNALNGTLPGDINWEPRHNNMPKNGNKLSDCDINKITAWIDQGAKDN